MAYIEQRTEQRDLANLLALGSFMLAAYIVSSWISLFMKHGLLARLASPVAFPMLVMINISSALGTWLRWKEVRRSLKSLFQDDSPIPNFLWAHVLGVAWTFSFFVLHSVLFSSLLAGLYVLASYLTVAKAGGPRNVSGALHIPLLLWASAMLMMNALFAAMKLGFLSFGGLQWWGVKHIGLGLFHTAQHLLLG